MSRQLNLQAFLVLSSFLPITMGLSAGRRKSASYPALGSGCCLQCRKENGMSPGRGRGTEFFLSNRGSDPVPERCHPQREAGMDRHSVDPHVESPHQDCVSLWLANDMSQIQTGSKRDFDCEG